MIETKPKVKCNCWTAVLQQTNQTQPRGLQYLTHAHSHITRAVAAMDSCFVLII